MVQVKDLSFLPAFEWGKPCFGAVATAEACFPTSTSQASFRTNKVHKTGFRAARLHHIDKPILEWGFSTDRLQWQLNSFKRKGIPCVIEFASQMFDKQALAQGETAEMKKWESYVIRLCDMDLSNVILAYAVNEPAQTLSDVWEYQCQTIKKAGYKGKIACSNESIQGRAWNWEMEQFGDVEDAHIYTGHPEGDFFFDCKYPEWTTRNTLLPDGNETYEPKSKLPLIVSECGAIYPNPQRGDSDVLMYRDLFKKGAKIIFPFAFATHPSDFLSGTPIDRDKWAMANDPIRMDALQFSMCELHGVPFVRNAFKPDLEVVKSELYNTSPTFKPVVSVATV